MAIKGSAKLLRIFIGESDKLHNRALYEALIYAAKKAELAGATAIRGLMSFGANSKIHSSKVLALSDDLPIIVEIVDSEEKIEGFIPIVDALFEKANCGGLITIEKADVIRYSPKKT
ncbi:MAG: DUF190 domain-containing protein [Bacteroidales bacterium]|nr:DUF190 domain-containing protein [Bacteroidales bacterium]